MTYPIDTAIFPVAGLGTRLLPATKSVPKELLPVYDTPLIQIAIDEARAAGIRRMVFVSHESKSAIEDYVRHDAALIRELEDRGKTELAQQIEALVPRDRLEIMFVMQQEALGLGHAILCATDAVDDGPVAVILPDDLIFGDAPALVQMQRAYDRGHAGHMVGAVEVPRDQTHLYGIFDADKPAPGRCVRVAGFVEKPDPADAPSCLAATGRYILDPSIFDALSGVTPGAGGEIQLTDAIAAGIDAPGVCAFLVQGQRFDCGSHEGLLAAGTARRDQAVVRTREHAA